MYRAVWKVNDAGPLVGLNTSFTSKHEPLIIVAGASGIAAGTPLAVLGAIGLAGRAGAIIKGGRYLETLWRSIPSHLTRPGR
jgi:cation transport ATPase